MKKHKFNITGDIKLSQYENVLIIPIKSRQTASNLIQDLEGNAKPIEIEIRQTPKKRSLDSNSYMWILCTAISKEMSKEAPITKEEVYKDYITQTNAYFPQPIRDDAVKKYKRIWENNGIGYLAIEQYPSKSLEGYTVMFCYYGSSEYDTKEMSDLISRIVTDCKVMHIETKTPAELAILNEDWRAKNG